MTIMNVTAHAPNTGHLAEWALERHCQDRDWRDALQPMPRRRCHEGRHPHGASADRDQIDSQIARGRQDHLDRITGHQHQTRQRSVRRRDPACSNQHRVRKRVIQPTRANQRWAQTSDTHLDRLGDMDDEQLTHSLRSDRRRDRRGPLRRARSARSVQNPQPNRSPLLVVNEGRANSRWLGDGERHRLLASHLNLGLSQAEISCQKRAAGYRSVRSRNAPG
jgi:hypothetical protein